MMRILALGNWEANRKQSSGSSAVVALPSLLRRLEHHHGQTTPAFFDYDFRKISSVEVTLQLLSANASVLQRNPIFAKSQAENTRRITVSYTNAKYVNVMRHNVSTYSMQS